MNKSFTFLFILALGFWFITPTGFDSEQPQVNLASSEELDNYEVQEPLDEYSREEDFQGSSRDPASADINEDFIDNLDNGAE